MLHHTGHRQSDASQCARQGVVLCWSYCWKNGRKNCTHRNVWHHEFGSCVLPEGTHEGNACRIVHTRRVSSDQPLLPDGKLTGHAGYTHQQSGSFSCRLGMCRLLHLDNKTLPHNLHLETEMNNEVFSDDQTY